jgi:hypothetical protein
MSKLRVPDGKASPESTPPWSAETKCTTCGEYTPCRCSNEANLAATLVMFARWRKCCVCGSETLFVDGRCRTDGDFECGLCQGIREELVKRLRRTSLPARAALHLRALLMPGNDNHEARP